MALKKDIKGKPKFLQMQQLQSVREKLKPYHMKQIPEMIRAITELNMLSSDLDLDIFLENNINGTLNNLQVLQRQFWEIDLKLQKLSNPIQP